MPCVSCALCSLILAIALCYSFLWFTDGEPGAQGADPFVTLTLGDSVVLKSRRLGAESCFHSTLQRSSTICSWGPAFLWFDYATSPGFCKRPQDPASCISTQRIITIHLLSRNLKPGGGSDSIYNLCTNGHKWCICLFLEVRYKVSFTFIYSVPHLEA